MKVYFAADHTGFNLKTTLIPFVQELGHDVEDLGSTVFDARDDYPDFVVPLAKRIAGEKGSLGVIIGASGQGEAMAANRIKGARAAVYYGEAAQSQTDADGKILNLLQSTRAHNDANILSLGARFVTEDEAKAALEKWLSTPFSNEARHMRRIVKLDD